MTEKHRNVPQGINYELQYTEKIMPMLVFNGYYHFNGSRNTIEGQVYYWRCVKRAELGVDKCSVSNVTGNIGATSGENMLSNLRFEGILRAL
ncbi:FLYWCH zinc finger domain-containing protein [Ditylenchus destructor]|uniref:FLYWCH zinc finger domain-containing protein n=1 Tax=Ditylenchus destructor TaxID=166010 RepID=A0AAD4MUA3_9BILA|nr:FLYWCH zinc finger domain-containing protein [Ditylenchus destructor]